MFGVYVSKLSLFALYPYFIHNKLQVYVYTAKTTKKAFFNNSFIIWNYSKLFKGHWELPKIQRTRANHLYDNHKMYILHCLYDNRNIRTWLKHANKHLRQRQYQCYGNFIALTFAVAGIVILYTNPIWRITKHQEIANYESKKTSQLMPMLHQVPVLKRLLLHLGKDLQQVFHLFIYFCLKKHQMLGGGGDGGELALLLLF